MTSFDGGRLGLSPFYNSDEVQNPFRGVFEEGVRQTAVDAAEAITDSRMRSNINLGYDLEEKLGNEIDWQDGAMNQNWSQYQPEMKADDPNAPPPVDPVNDPGRALSSSTSVRAHQGGGLGTVTPMPVPKPSMVARQVEDQVSKQVMFDQNKIPAWQDSKAIGSGLLSFGLNLLSGNDLATSFNQAGAHFEKEFGREKREIWAQDLVEQGYDAHEIQSWIATGDHKALTNPMKKKMEQQAFRLGQAQLQKAEYENSPEYLAWKAEREYKKDLNEERRLQLQELSTTSNIEANRIAANLAERKFKYQQKKDEIKSQAEKLEKVAPRDAILAAQQLAVDLEMANQPIPVGGGVGSSLLKNVAGEEIGSHLLTSPDAAKMFPETYKANQIRVAQNQFTENGIRLATGALVRPAEQEMFRNYLFPQGKDFDNPAIVARKRATQDVINTIARNVGTGRSRAFDPANMMRIAQSVSEGTARVIKRDGMVIGLMYNDGTVQQF